MPKTTDEILLLDKLARNNQIMSENNISFNTWNQYQTDFMEALSLGLINRHDAIVLSYTLSFPSVICTTNIEKENLEIITKGTRNFLGKLSDNDFTKNNKTDELSIGKLYFKEIVDAATPTKQEDRSKRLS